MPNSCWGRYGRVGVLEVDATLDRVSMISERARGCIRVVETWDRRFHGITPKCAFSRAVAEARELAAELNAQTIAQRLSERHRDMGDLMTACDATAGASVCQNWDDGTTTWTFDDGSSLCVDDAVVAWVR